jgi:hypothetical protein
VRVVSLPSCTRESDSFNEGFRNLTFLPRITSRSSFYNALSSGAFLFLVLEFIGSGNLEIEIEICRQPAERLASGCVVQQVSNNFPTTELSNSFPTDSLRDQYGSAYGHLTALCCSSL